MTTIKNLFDIAVARFNRKAFTEAENLFLQIRNQIPDDIETLHYLAKIALVQGRYDTAAISLGKVAAVKLDNADVLTELGRTYLGLGRLQDALTCLKRAAIICPDNGKIHRLTAEVFFALKQYDLAIEAASKAVALCPTDAEAHEVLGNGLLDSRNPQRAIECYDKSLDLNSDNWKAWANRGTALFLLNRLIPAKESLIFANALNPMEPETLQQLASVLIELCEHDDASVLLEKLSAMMPQHAKVYLLSGINTLKQGITKTATAHFFKAAALDEDNSEIKYLLAEALVHDGKPEPAVNILDGIIKEGGPHHVNALIQKAKVQLLLGDIDAASLTVNALHAAEKIELIIPRWNGEDLSNKTIFLYSRFGLDELNVLVRLSHVLKERGATVYVECTEPVRSLVSAMVSVDKTFLPGEPLDLTVDYCASLEFLFGALGSPKSILSIPAYFSINDDLRKKWIQHFSKIKKPKIGLMWRKETHVQKNIYHSVPLSALSPLFELKSADFVSLQTGTGLSELETFSYREELYMVGLENASMSDRLACISELDLLIAPDTLTAEVAAAAGLPVWVLLGTVPPWYWGITGTSAPLFPSARLFRQSEINRWDDVVSEVISALSADFLI